MSQFGKEEEEEEEEEAEDALLVPRQEKQYSNFAQVSRKTIAQQKAPKGRLEMKRIYWKHDPSIKRP
jgi:hypothetical protein